MSKAIELPINVLVIVAIAIIVLLGLVAVYVVGFNPFSVTVSLNALKNQGCINFSLNYNCGSRGTSTTDIKLQANTYNVNNLLDLCKNYLGASTEVDCRIICGCGAVTAGGGGGCTPSCTGKACGSDGCTGTCPPGCSGTQVCNSNGQCVASCTPSCTGKACGSDGCGTNNNCGPITASCTAQFGTCTATGTKTCSGSSYGNCVATDPRTQNCVGKCGSDGCGGNCGACPTGQTCNSAGLCTGTVICSCNWVDQDCNTNYWCWGGHRYLKRMYVCNSPSCSGNGGIEYTWNDCGSVPC